MYKNLFRGAILVAALVLSISLGMSSSVAHAAVPTRVLVAPSSVTITQSQPDSNGGVWVHTVRAWKTAVPLSKPDANGDVYATIAPSASPYICTLDCGGGCTNGYTTLINGWHYQIGPTWFLAIDFDTQDHWDNCVGNVANKYVDPQCVSYIGSTCDSWSSGVYHDVQCDVSPTFGTCNQDWANINTFNSWTQQHRWQYMRTWVDIYGDYRFVNNVG